MHGLANFKHILLFIVLSGIDKKFRIFILYYNFD